MEGLTDSFDPHREPPRETITKTWELVLIPDPYGPPTRLWVEFTTPAQGPEVFLFAEREDNENPRWGWDQVRFRTELINAITKNGSAMTTRDFRFIEYRPGSTHLFEEYTFEMGAHGKLQQVQSSILHNVAQLSRLVPEFDPDRLPEPPRDPPPDYVGEELRRSDLPSRPQDPAPEPGFGPEPGVGPQPGPEPDPGLSPSF